MPGDDAQIRVTADTTEAQRAYYELLRVQKENEKAMRDQARASREAERAAKDQARAQQEVWTTAKGILGSLGIATGVAGAISTIQQGVERWKQHMADVAKLTRDATDEMIAFTQVQDKGTAGERARQVTGVGAILGTVTYIRAARRPVRREFRVNGKFVLDFAPPSRYPRVHATRRTDRDRPTAAAAHRPAAQAGSTRWEEGRGWQWQTWKRQKWVTVHSFLWNLPISTQGISLSRNSSEPSARPMRARRPESVNSAPVAVQTSPELSETTW